MLLLWCCSFHVEFRDSKLKFIPDGKFQGLTSQVVSVTKRCYKRTSSLGSENNRPGDISSSNLKSSLKLANTL